MTCGFSSLYTEITLDSSINALSLLFSVSPAKGFLQLKNYISEPSHLLSWEVFSPSPFHHHLYISKEVQNSKNPSFCLQFHIFFKKIPLSLSKQPEQFHFTLTLCFAFSHLRLCFIFFKASLSDARWQQDRCYRIMFHFYLYSEAKFSVLGDGQNNFLTAFGYLLNTLSSGVWCLFSDDILHSTIATNSNCTHTKANTHYKSLKLTYKSMNSRAKTLWLY